MSGGGGGVETEREKLCWMWGGVTWKVKINDSFGQIEAINYEAESQTRGPVEDVQQECEKEK